MFIARFFFFRGGWGRKEVGIGRNKILDRMDRGSMLFLFSQWIQFYEEGGIQLRSEKHS